MPNNMMKKMGRGGRRNDSLLDDAGAGRADEQTLVDAVVASLQPNPYQPRHIFEPEALQQLANSLAEEGLHEPIVIYEDDDSGQTYIAAGERRWRAAQMNGWPTIKAIHRGPKSPLWARTTALVENFGRADLILGEKITGLAALAEITSLSNRELARKVGESEQNVGKYLKIARYPQLVAEINRLEQQGKRPSLQDYYARAQVFEPDENRGRKKLPRISAQPPSHSVQHTATQPAASGNGRSNGANQLVILQPSDSHQPIRSSAAPPSGRSSRLSEMTADIAGLRSELAFQRPGDLDQRELEELIVEANQLYQTAVAMRR